MLENFHWSQVRKVEERHIAKAEMKAGLFPDRYKQLHCDVPETQPAALATAFPASSRCQGPDLAEIQRQLHFPPAGGRFKNNIGKRRRHIKRQNRAYSQHLSFFLGLRRYSKG